MSLPSEYLRNEYDEVRECDYCGVGAATYTMRIDEYEKQQDYNYPEAFYLCALCSEGSVRARGILVFKSRHDDTAIIEQALGRYLNAMQGTTAMGEGGTDE